MLYYSGTGELVKVTASAKVKARFSALKLCFLNVFPTQHWGAGAAPRVSKRFLNANVENAISAKNLVRLYPSRRITNGVS